MSGRKTSPPPARPVPLWIAIALALVTMAVFWPVTRFQFVDYDDTDFVTANPHVQAGLTVEGFKWIWRSEVARNWHPVTMLTHMLDCQLFGVQPWWPHLVNLLLHAANTLLLFGLWRRMTGAVWRSAAVAALFALHPLHVESVAWVAERKDELSTFFWFLATWAYVRYADLVGTPRCGVRSAQRADPTFKFFYFLSLLLFALGLMSKPMLVTLPFTLLLLDCWPLGRMKSGAAFWRLAAEKTPFFALSAVLCVVTYQVQQHGGAVLRLQDFPLGSRLGNALVSYVRYIERMFWPRHLAGLYLRSGEWAWWQVALAALFLLTVSALVLAQRRRRPYLAVGWFWYAGTLVPVAGLLQVGMQAMADRYTYVPLIGLFVILVWGGWELAGAWGVARFAPAAAAAALVVCAVLTVHQEFYWKNSEALFKRMIDATPNNYMARYNLGNFYAKAGRTNEAISNLTAAVEGEPNYAEAHNNLGGIFLEQKRYDEALPHYRIAVRLHPEYLYYFNLANALADAASRAPRHQPICRGGGRLLPSAATQSRLKRGAPQSGPDVAGARPPGRGPGGICASRAPGSQPGGLLDATGRPVRVAKQNARSGERLPRTRAPATQQRRLLWLPGQRAGGAKQIGRGRSNLFDSVAPQSRRRQNRIQPGAYVVAPWKARRGGGPLPPGVAHHPQLSRSANRLAATGRRGKSARRTKSVRIGLPVPFFSSKYL